MATQTVAAPLPEPKKWTIGAAVAGLLLSVIISALRK